MRKKDKKTSFAIIGAGRFGSALARTLAEAGKDVIIADKDEEAVRELRDITDYAYVTDSISKETFAEMGIGDCGTVIIGIGEHIDTSILTTLNVINLGVERVIAKALSTEHGAVLEKLGAEVVYPERDSGIRLGRMLVSDNLIESVMLNDDVEIAEINATEKIIGKNIFELSLREKFGVNVIAVEHNGKTDVELTPQTAVCVGDRLLVIGKRDTIRRAMDYFV